MSRSSIISKRFMTMIMTLALLLAAAIMPASAQEETGTLTINPTYEGKVIANCTFKLYQVATYESGTFTLTDAFANAEVTIGEVKNNSQQAEAATEFLKLVPDATAYNSTSENGNSNTFTGITLGAYLVVEDSAPKGYSLSSPFLVFFPSSNWKVNEEGTMVGDGTLITTIDASPKLKYENPEGQNELSVTKVWVNDNASTRPSSVEITLYKDGEAYDTVTLNSENDWSHTWKLNHFYTWTVTETSTHTNYKATYVITTGSVVVRNTYSTGTSGGTDPDDPSTTDPGTKPGTTTPGTNTGTTTPDTTPIEIEELGENEVPLAGETAPAEPIVMEPEPETPSVSIIDDVLVPLADALAPQTGLVQWPIPVLLLLGACLIAWSRQLERKKRYG